MLFSWLWVKISTQHLRCIKLPIMFSLSTWSYSIKHTSDSCFHSMWILWIKRIKKYHVSKLVRRGCHIQERQLFIQLYGVNALFNVFFKGLQRGGKHWHCFDYVFKVHLLYINSWPCLYYISCRLFKVNIILNMYTFYFAEIWRYFSTCVTW